MSSLRCGRVKIVAECGTSQPLTLWAEKRVREDCEVEEEGILGTTNGRAGIIVEVQ